LPNLKSSATIQVKFTCATRFLAVLYHKGKIFCLPRVIQVLYPDGRGLIFLGVAKTFIKKYHTKFNLTIKKRSFNYHAQLNHIATRNVHCTIILFCSQFPLKSVKIIMTYLKKVVSQKKTTQKNCLHQSFG
jgi:hypothetical protein